MYRINESFKSSTFLDLNFVVCSVSAMDTDPINWKSPVFSKKTSFLISYKFNSLLYVLLVVADSKSLLNLKSFSVTVSLFWIHSYCFISLFSSLRFLTISHFFFRFVFLFYSLCFFFLLFYIFFSSFFIWVFFCSFNPFFSKFFCSIEFVTSLLLLQPYICSWQIDFCSSHHPFIREEFIEKKLLNINTLNKWRLKFALNVKLKKYQNVL